MDKCRSCSYAEYPPHYYDEYPPTSRCSHAQTCGLIEMLISKAIKEHIEKCHKDTGK